MNDDQLTCPHCGAFGNKITAMQRQYDAQSMQYQLMCTRCFATGPIITLRMQVITTLQQKQPPPEIFERLTHTWCAHLKKPPIKMKGPNS